MHFETLLHNLFLYFHQLSLVTRCMYIAVLAAGALLAYGLIRVAIVYRRDCAIGRGQCWFCGSLAGARHVKGCASGGGFQ